MSTLKISRVRRSGEIITATVTVSGEATPQMFDVRLNQGLVEIPGEMSDTLLLGPVPLRGGAERSPAERMLVRIATVAEASLALSPEASPLLTDLSAIAGQTSSWLTHQGASLDDAPEEELAALLRSVCHS